MGHRSIRFRMLAAFVLAFVAMASTIGYSISELRTIGKDLDAVNAGFLPMAKVAVELGALTRQLDRDHDRFARQGSAVRSNATLYRSGIEDLVKQGHESAQHAANLSTQPEDIAAIERIKDVLVEIESQTKEYEDTVEEWLRAEEADDTAKASRLVADLDRRRQLLSAAGTLIQAIIDGQVEQVNRRTVVAQNEALLISVSLGALSLLLASLITAFALRALRPIGQLTTQVQRIAAGERSSRVALSSNDEMGVLAREFNVMADAVADRDAALQERAETIDRVRMRLRKVLDTITAGLLVTENKQILMCNPAATSLWNSQTSEPMPKWLANLEPGLHESVHIADQIYTIHVEPFGESGTLIVGEDVTERVMVRERLMRTERLALVGRMLAQVTHEVRNPLNAMSLNAEMLADELSDAEATAMLDTITGEIRRLETITGRYLHLSRKRVPQMARITPTALIERLIDVEQAAMSAAGVSTHVHSTSEETIEIDVDAVDRTLRNLLRNSIEAGAKSINIEVSTHNEVLQVTVFDDGPGMSKDEAAQAFDPFFTTKARGTGLGLAIARQELEEIGGGLTHVPHRNGGAQFTVTVPVQA